MASNTYGAIKLSTAEDVGAVLKKKTGSADGYKPKEWADTINLLGLLPIRTASGTIAHFEDGADSVPMKSVVANIVPIQDLHGYSKPWAAGAGKNICDLNTKSPTTSATVNLEVKTDNEIIMNGTATGGTCDLLVSLKKNIIFDGVNPLTISLTGTDVRTANLNVYLRKIDNTFSSPYGILTNTHYVTIPTSFSGEVKEIMFRISRDESVNIDAKVQIEQGSTATSYEPYANVCPISGTDELNVEQRGNNYFDQVYPNIDSNVNYKAVSVPNGTYTMETTCPAPNGLANLFFLAGNVQSGASTGTNGVWKGQTRTITVSDGYFTIAYRNANGANPQNYFAIVFDKSTAYTFDLGQEIMGGTADVVGGTGTNTLGKLDLSSLEWIYSSTYQRFSTTSQVAGIKTPPNNNTVANILCSHFGSDTSNNTAEVGKDNIIGVSMTGVIQIRDTSLNGDISALMTLLENVDFTYELATPTEYTFTGQPINSYLGVNNLYVDSGEVLDVEYRADMNLLIAELGG